MESSGPCGTLPSKQPANQLAYFHATYRDYPNPTPGEDLVLLDTRKRKAPTEWSGSFVGTSFIFSHNANLRTLEGDPRFFFDDSLTPQAQGTGTEEWGGGGDYWGGMNMTLALCRPSCGGAHVHRRPCDEQEDKIESAYRFLLGRSDAVRQERTSFTLSTAVPTNRRNTTRRSPTGMDCRHRHPSWKPTSLRSAMRRLSTLTITPHRKLPRLIPSRSRYEWGVDTLNGKDHLPRAADHGPHHQGHIGVSSQASRR